MRMIIFLKLLKKTVIKSVWYVVDIALFFARKAAF